MSTNELTFGVLDTETTGKWDFKADRGANHQPHMVQLGLQVYDEKFRVKAELNTLIKPNGWAIPAEAQAIHGISIEDCERFGMSSHNALAIAKGMLESVDVVVCHNTDYDFRIIDRSCLLINKESILSRARQFCTMKATTNLLKLPGVRGYGYKWPSLQELHNYFFGKDFDAAHDAMADVRATARCLEQIVLRHPELMRAA